MSAQCKLFAFLIAILTTLLALTSAHAQADCSKIKKQIERYEDLRRNGGSAKSMSRWTATGHQLDEKYRQCNQGHSVIQVASGKPSRDRKKATTRKHMPLRKNESNSPQLNKLTQTCNYWIGVANENPTDDNTNFRETACNAADNYKAESDNLTPLADTVMVRKLKDCIKSNNLIDQEVNDCMRGTLEPIWKK
jgi:hypothetical protein